MTHLKLSQKAVLAWLAGAMSLVPLGRALASDNSYSKLEVIQLLTGEGGSRHISTTPPPVVPPPQPPSLQVLQQELATQEQTLASQQAGLTSAQSMLTFFQNQASQHSAAAVAGSTPTSQQAQDAQEAQELQATDIPEWTQAVASDQKLVATIQSQIVKLQLQIAAAQQ